MSTLLHPPRHSDPLPVHKVDATCVWRLATARLSRLLPGLPGHGPQRAILPCQSHRYHHPPSTTRTATHTRHMRRPPPSRNRRLFLCQACFPTLSTQCLPDPNQKPSTRTTWHSTPERASLSIRRIPIYLCHLHLHLHPLCPRREPPSRPGGSALTARASSSKRASPLEVSSTRKLVASQGPEGGPAPDKCHLSSVRLVPSRAHTVSGEGASAGDERSPEDAQATSAMPRAGASSPHPLDGDLRTVHVGRRAPQVESSLAAYS